ncbi:MAG: hypothetical protein JWQ16_2060 [Novosphingobium sp.]|nr:hypothetical protein [Novosphingobium sp.]
MIIDAQPEPDTSSSPAPLAQILPQFAPVPRAKERSDGWKADVQYAFIEALAETGSVRTACAIVHRSDHGAYMLRRHPEAEEFRAAWDAALDIGLRRIEDVAMDRALNGVDVPIIYHGENRGSRKVYNDRLLMFMLRNRAPERFGGGLRENGGARGHNAIDQMTLTRLKKQWQKEYQAAIWADQSKRSDQVMAELNTKLERRHQSWLAELSPHVRALYDAYREAELDQEAGRGLPPLPLLPGVSWHTEQREDPA